MNDADARTDVDASQDSSVNDAYARTAVDAAPESSVDSGSEGAVYPAPHPILPRAVSMGGPVLAAPKVHLIVYPGYPYESQLQTFARKLGASGYWSAATSEYGVGAVEYAGTTELTGEVAPAIVTEAEIASYLNEKIRSGAFGIPDVNTLYTLLYPETTIITGTSDLDGGPIDSDAGDRSCAVFGGYHDDIVATGGDGGDGGAMYPYAVIPLCRESDGGLSADSVTGPLSHEWAEGVTDPYPSDNPAYASVDDDHFLWFYLGGGGEIGDLCVADPEAFFQPPDLGFRVQRIWSNRLAGASHNPCAPDSPGEPYFNSAPVLTDRVLFQNVLSNAIEGVTIPVGQSRTIEVDLFSDAPTSGPWTVVAIDPIALGTQTAPSMTFAWDRTEGVNGDRLHLTITVGQSSSLGGLSLGGNIFAIESKLGSLKHLWPGAVGN